ncbi:MAG TPA: efflux RND transporter periplasmic adaptor subunit [Burkholderiales bacterium]|jgi:HlyD family secretion protein|nr:efflux RND transporter periplasmic adaptor subunit [Burkholderiales bacterium]
MRRSNSDALAWACKRRWRIAAAMLVAAAGAYFGYLQLAGPKVEAARVVRRDVVQSVVAAGRVAAPNRVDIGAQIVGTVARVPVAEGQVVKAGQPLIVLDASELSAAVAQARATLANTAAQLERNRRLQAQGFVGAAALDDAQRNFDVARTQLDAARAKLAYTLIKAPADGTLIARDVERGELVQPGKVLMVLSPAGATQIVLQIDERNLARLKPGQRALASADAYPEERFAAELAYINPGIDAQRGTVEVKLALSQPPEYLRQDMTVSVDIETGRHAQTLALAADAVRDASGAAPWVLAVRNGRTVRQGVSLGLRGDAVVEILEGLAEGEIAVRAGNATIRAGQAVRPVVHE